VSPSIEHRVPNNGPVVSIATSHERSQSPHTHSLAHALAPLKQASPQLTEDNTMHAQLHHMIMCVIFSLRVQVAQQRSDACPVSTISNPKTGTVIDDVQEDLTTGRLSCSLPAFPWPATGPKSSHCIRLPLSKGVPKSRLLLAGHVYTDWTCASRR